MKIKYITWKHIIYGDVQRLTYGIKTLDGSEIDDEDAESETEEEPLDEDGSEVEEETSGEGESEAEKGKKERGKKAKKSADHAIEFGRPFENPSVWYGFTDGAKIPVKKVVEKENAENGTSLPTVFPVPLNNSSNTINVWQGDAIVRKNKLKINAHIHNSAREEDVIEVWYVAYMRLLLKLLKQILKNNPDEENAKQIKALIEERLDVLPKKTDEWLDWVKETQDAFSSLEVKTLDCLRNENAKDINGFVQDYYYLVIRYENDLGEDKNDALVCNIKSKKLHPEIKKIIESGEMGGEFVNIPLDGYAIDSESQACLDKLLANKNIILYGAPGTGKTRTMMQIIDAFTAYGNYDCTDTEAPISIGTSSEQPCMKWCTFHPGYTYDSFVWGLTPTVEKGKLGYVYHKGPFLSQACESLKGTKTLLVIDEINRANTDDVFGDTIRLLQTSGRDKASVKLPKKIVFEDEEELEEIKCGEDFYVIGTMNSLDKSVAPLSPELKRIFSVVEIGPNSEALEDALKSVDEIPTEFTEYLINVYTYINDQIREYVGKEYMLGQGYLWDVISNSDSYEATMADVIKYKIMPHLKDVFPEEHFAELFKATNLGVLFTQSDLVCEILDVSRYDDATVINAFAEMVESGYRSASLSEAEDLSFEEYDKKKTDEIRTMLKKYKNVTLTGVTGTGKSFILDRIAQDEIYADRMITYWHNSTSYEDTIEGISAELSGKNIKYAYQAGMIKGFADSNKYKQSFVGIENVDRSDAGSNFGELITLLEPDKRASVEIEGYEGKIIIPEGMHFLCTSRPLTKSTNKMDSALKRRFIIKELYPDYKLLSLWYGIEDIEVVETDFDTREGRLKIALNILRELNKGIIECMGVDSQIGHAIMWKLKDTASCELVDIEEIFDDTILPMLEDICSDPENAQRILGSASPLIKFRKYGVEILKFVDLGDDDQRIKAIKEMLHFEI